MKIFSCILLFLFCAANATAQQFSSTEINEWKKQAERVTIIRDNYGIPHVYGKTDADAVFGLLYAQCEDDFARVEMNYIEKLGRLSEVKGEASLYDDLFLRMLIDSADAIADYKKAEPWLKKLLTGFAAGINYYLASHPSVKPALLKRFEPWYPLLWTDGSIGAISAGGLDAEDVRAFYEDHSAAVRTHKNAFTENNIGSNGFAIAPSKSLSGNAMLYINPHVTFYFRPEVHMVSEEGLNAYGAVTWGQFFIYQGFNEHCGWMHTSSDADVADVYRETQVGKGITSGYQYENTTRTVLPKTIVIRVKAGDRLIDKKFFTSSTHHGPVMARDAGGWLSVRSNNRSMAALKQSWLRTKAKGFEDYKSIMQLRSNTSNNTVFADDAGNIAYWHGNFMPKRDPKFNWSKPVPGNTRATEWKGLHAVNEAVHVYNPASGWIQNCNSTPFTASGSSSPQKEKYPAYMAPDGENFRGINAARLLAESSAFDLDKLISIGYDRQLAAFEVLVPALLRAAGNTDHKGIPGKAMDVMRNWDYRVSVSSIATALAVEWSVQLAPLIAKSASQERFASVDQVMLLNHFAKTASAEILLNSFAETIRLLEKNHGTWMVPWGDINRFQRVSPSIDHVFNDDSASIAIPFASAALGMLPSYVARYFPGTKKRYGVNGNSFICAVEFGKKVKAKSLLAGGESGDPASAHFKDQAEMYAAGRFKDVLFYREEVERNAVKTYRPGEKLVN